MVTRLMNIFLLLERRCASFAEDPLPAGCVHFDCNLYVYKSKTVH